MVTLIQLMQETLNTLDPALPNETKRIHLKELLQAYTLDFIYNHAEYRRLNFYGGTCLHTVYGLNRLSEDIDLDKAPGSAGIIGSRPVDLLSQRGGGETNAPAKTQEGEWGILRTTLKFPLLNAPEPDPLPQRGFTFEGRGQPAYANCHCVAHPAFLAWTQPGGRPLFAGNHDGR